MIYLASPYSFNPSRGFAMAQFACFHLHKRGEIVFSPIVHWHGICKMFELPGDADYWWRYNQEMMRRSDRMTILNVPRFTAESKGVQMEMEWWAANKPGTHIEMLAYGDLYRG